MGQYHKNATSADNLLNPLRILVKVERFHYYEHKLYDVYLNVF